MLIARNPVYRYPMPIPPGIFGADQCFFGTE